ncbi:MAG: PhnD/SsuA/transferrin family substrate-binding protein [Bryobacterales bacterium]|nr:PhnD/SsuA/transferrin family substrate-binding protein [Bryobacterales bacterium]
MGVVMGAAAAPGTLETPLRIAISEQAVPGVNRNDAAAALAVWADEMAKAVNLRLADKVWLRPSAEVLAALRTGNLDLLCLTVPEYRRVAAFLDTERVLTDGGQEMWVMAAQGSGITKLSGLAGRHLIILDSPQTQLVDAWLTGALFKEGLSGKEPVRVTRQTRPAQAILPVFFGQADACVASKRTVETMYELNPQLGKKLRVVQASPKLVGAFMACRKDYPAHYKIPLLEKLTQARDSPAGKQVMTLFSSFNFVMTDGEVLRPSLAVVEGAEKLNEVLLTEKR